MHCKRYYPRTSVCKSFFFLLEWTQFPSFKRAWYYVFSRGDPFSQCFYHPGCLKPLVSTTQYLVERLLRFCEPKSDKHALVNNILLVDSDLGFIFWLGQILDEAGYEAVPAKSVSDGIKLLAEISIPIHLLILDPALPAAASLISILRQKEPNLKVIAVPKSQTVAGNLAGVDIIQVKTCAVDRIARDEWVKVVQEALIQSPIDK